MIISIAEIKIDAKTAQAIEAILKRGNDAEVRRRGSGVVVSEVKKQIKYSTRPIEDW